MLITLSGTQYDVSIKLQHYKNGRLRIHLIDNVDGMTVCTPSINLPDEECEIGHCWIKDYAENSGIYEQLLDLKVVENGLLNGSCSYKMVNGSYIIYCKFLNSQNS